MAEHNRGEEASPTVAEPMESTFAMEDKIGLSAAARLIGPGRGGRPTNPATILRWIKSGVRNCIL